MAIASELAGVDAGWLQEIQTGRHLRYGAWLGGRHLGDDDELKVYGEFPTGAPASLPMQHPALDGLGLEWRIGGIAMDGAVELYGRGSIDDITIDRCEQAAFGTTGALRDATARLVGCPDLPRPAMFSIAVHPERGVEALTWFRFAQRMFPDHDGRAHRPRPLVRRRRAPAAAAGAGGRRRRWSLARRAGRCPAGCRRRDQRPGGDPALVSSLVVELLADGGIRLTTLEGKTGLATVPVLRDWLAEARSCWCDRAPARRHHRAGRGARSPRRSAGWRPRSTSHRRSRRRGRSDARRSRRQPTTASPPRSGTCSSGARRRTSGAGARRRTASPCSGGTPTCCVALRDAGTPTPRGLAPPTGAPRRRRAARLRAAVDVVAAGAVRGARRPRRDRWRLRDRPGVPRSSRSSASVRSTSCSATRGARFDGPHVARRRGRHWQGPIDLRTLDALGCTPPGTVRMPLLWVLGQRQAGDRPDVYATSAFDPDQRAALGRHRGPALRPAVRGAWLPVSGLRASCRPPRRPRERHRRPRGRRAPEGPPCRLRSGGSSTTTGSTTWCTPAASRSCTPPPTSASDARRRSRCCRTTTPPIPTSVSASPARCRSRPTSTPIRTWSPCTARARRTARCSWPRSSSRA